MVIFLKLKFPLTFLIITGVNYFISGSFIERIVLHHILPLLRIPYAVMIACDFSSLLKFVFFINGCERKKLTSIFPH